MWLTSSRFSSAFESLMRSLKNWLTMRSASESLAGNGSPILSKNALVVLLTGGTSGYLALIKVVIM